MKKRKRWLALATALVMLMSIVTTVVAADTGPTVESVTAMLQAIDTLQQMQDKRDTYTTNGHWDRNTNPTTASNITIINNHTTKRDTYETYLANMFLARAEAQVAYDSLSPEEQAQIDPALVAKLSTELATTFNVGTYDVTPRDDEYVFETVGPSGYAYEVSHYMTAGEIPQTFVLVDTSNGETSWTPSEGEWVSGVSNYEVTYCTDYDTGLEWGMDYRRLNLEDSTYYDDESARRIRAIVQNSYPFISIDEMKANMKADGMDPAFVDSLNRSDIIAGVQMAIWQCSNADAVNAAKTGYFASISIKKNTGYYFTPLHDHTNEIWEWFPKAKQRSYDTRAGYRVNNLIYYLSQFEGVEAENRSIIITDMKVGRVDLVPRTEDVYNIGLHVMLNAGCIEGDNVTLQVRSYSEDENGNVIVTSTDTVQVGAETEYVMTVNAKCGDTVEVSAVGNMYVDKGVYFYEAEGGRDVSQSLVGVSSGNTPVRATQVFTFEEDVDMGLRLYKKSSVDQAPISDITFDVYEVEAEEGETLSQTPTDEELAKYATTENLVGSITTDITGYACLELPEGTYLVIERHNPEKVKEPAAPFYIYVPWPVEKEIEGDDGTEVIIEYLDVVSIYPKNTPVEPPPPPPPPVPEDVYGQFKIFKHDRKNSNDGLAGAQFRLYRAATAEDTDTEILLCNGKSVRVVPMTTDEGDMVLTTDAYGSATSTILTPGQYYVEEIKAPIGYVMDANNVTAITITSTAIQQIPVLYIANDRGIELPATGGSGTAWILTIGGALVLMALLLLITKRRMATQQ